jgi:hypothetical protein
MRDPHLYRLRNGTVRKKTARNGEGEMRKGLLEGFSPASAKAMRFGDERQRLCQAMNSQLAYRCEVRSPIFRNLSN